MTTQIFGSPVTAWESITIGPWTFANTKITLDGNVDSKIDVAPAPGTDGARETYLGYIPAKLSIAILLYSNPDLSNPDVLFQSFAALISQVKPKPGKTAPSPISISYPLLRIYGLSQFLVQGTPIMKTIGPQMWDGRLNVVEYFPKPKTSGKQSATTIATLPSIFDGANRATPTDPQTDNTGP